MNKTEPLVVTSYGKSVIAFTGTARQYFGVWIVNLILSIITLGIYSAWAKVKRETYFKNNTNVFNENFGYHATGGQILRGRILALFVILSLNVFASFKPIAGIILYIGLIFLFPWVLNLSLRFSARMTSYRNIRFNWHGTYGQTLWFLITAPIFGLLTLGVLTPFMSKLSYSYIARSYSYGTTRFKADPKTRDFYIAFLLGVVIPFIILVVILIPLGLLFFDNTFPVSEKFRLVALIPLLLYILLFFVVFIYNILCRNLLLKSLALENIVIFESRINPIKAVWISVSNLVVTVLSLGLLIPWSKVRMYRYLCSMTTINAIGDIETFIDETKSPQSSFSEGVADFEGIEVSI